MKFDHEAFRAKVQLATQEPSVLAAIARDRWERVRVTGLYDPEGRFTPRWIVQVWQDEEPVLCVPCFSRDDAHRTLSQALAILYPEHKGKARLDRAEECDMGKVRCWEATTPYGTMLGSIHGIPTTEEL